jgi:hypothetical protein
MLRKVVEKVGRDQQKSTLKCQARNTAGKTGDTTYTFNIKCEYDGSAAVCSKEGRSVGQCSVLSKGGSIIMETHAEM